MQRLLSSQETWPRDPEEMHFLFCRHRSQELTATQMTLPRRGARSPAARPCGTFPSLGSRLRAATATKDKSSAGPRCWSQDGGGSQVWVYYLCIKYTPWPDLKQKAEEHLWPDPGHAPWSGCRVWHEEPGEGEEEDERGCGCILTAARAAGCPECCCSNVAPSTRRGPKGREQKQGPAQCRSTNSRAQFPRPGPQGAAGRQRTACPHQPSPHAGKAL